ncbi:MAG TPA: class I SAM-dependent methyltransferase [Chryseosolibacter sp.]
MDKLLLEVERYYSEKIRTHGSVPAGVDWNSEDSQFTRFLQLLKIADGGENFSLLDFGCGYCALYFYMKSRFEKFSYTGYDISTAMLQEAKRLTANEPVQLVDNASNISAHDFTVASGIFNVRQNSSETDWQNYVLETLQQINSVSRKGFSFNMLTSYSDDERKKSYLYYPDPAWFFDYCKKNFSKQVALLHDYNLFEFTILVRK